MRNDGAEAGFFVHLVNGYPCPFFATCQGPKARREALVAGKKSSADVDGTLVRKSRRFFPEPLRACARDKDVRRRLNEPLDGLQSDRGFLFEVRKPSFLPAAQTKQDCSSGRVSRTYL